MIKLFVYGTLKVGGRLSDSVERYLRGFMPAELEGFDLYDIGGFFPGIVSGAGRIVGELHTYDDKALNVLDGIEGYYPDSIAGSLYLRKEVEVVDGNGVRSNAFVYVFNRSIEKYNKIESGEWVLD